jgi:hypothetical protein
VDGSAVWLNEPGCYPEERALAAPVSPEHRTDLTGRGA